MIADDTANNYFSFSIISCQINGALQYFSVCGTDCACINRAVGIKVIHTKNPIQFDFR